MRNILVFFILIFTLTSCSYLHVHKMDIEQGNILTADKVDRIHTGMTKQDVTDILGPPELANVFNPSHMNYVYTFKPGYGPESRKYLTLRFRGNTLVDIQKDLYSQTYNYDAS
jgi:outer membrane protein assembly factor BamE